MKDKWLVSRKHKKEETVIDIEGVKIGGDNLPVVIAGPCAIESKGQIMEIAHAVKQAGAGILRGGAYKPRTSPDSFQGLGDEGVRHLAEAGRAVGMPTDTEALSEKKIGYVAESCSIIHIGTRNGKNYELAKDAGRLANQYGKAVLLKRGESAKIKEFLGAAEYIAREGCRNILLCLRGIISWDNGYTRYTSDIDAIPVLKRLTHLPIIFDPSHATGDKELIKDMSLAAIAAGADGLMIETHTRPEKALCDSAQQITPERLTDIIKAARTMHDTKRLIYDSTADNSLR